MVDRVVRTRRELNFTTTSRRRRVGCKAIANLTPTTCAGNKGWATRMLPCHVLLYLVVIVGHGTSGQEAIAEEPARAFLDGLRARGYHDVAIDYLASLESSRLTPPEMRQILSYERALTLVAASRQERDLERRFEVLDQAQSLLQEFIEGKEIHPKSYAARSQLGNLIVERARIKVEESKSGETARKLQEARKLYDRAFDQFAELEAAVTAELDQIPKVLDLRDREEARLAARRKQLRADNLQTELLAAAIREEAADTVPDGSKDHTAYLTEAAALYDAIYKKYRSRLAGMYARMYQGRCNFRLGKTKDALGYYGELLDQPSEPESFWNLKSKTLRLAMEAWLTPSERKYMEAIKQASNWIASAPRNSQRNPDMLAIRLSLARAFQMQADAFRKRDPKDARTINVSLDSARKHADFVASEPGDLQEEAQELVVRLGGRQKIATEDAPATFAAAQRAGKKALDELGPASEEVNQLARRLRRAAPGDRVRIQEELSSAKQALAASQDQALESYQLAMQLADRDTPPSELNLVRYFVCYLYYMKQQYWEAALMGDFVSQREPQSAGAKPSAKIALACYLQLLEDVDADETPRDKSSPNSDATKTSGSAKNTDGWAESSNEFELRRVATLTRFIASTWPQTPEAVESIATVVPVMVNAGELQVARELTSRLPEDTGERSIAELVTGQALWGAHLQWQQSVGGATEEGEVDLEQLATQASELLKAGYERLDPAATVTNSIVTAILSLAQSLVASGDYVGAIEVLENPEVGPLALLDQGHAATENPVYVQESLRTALQAYVGAMSTDPPAMMKKAKQTMVSLRQAVGEDAIGKQRMLAIYVNLAQSIESQLSSAEPSARQEMSKVFEAFLQELSAGSSEVGVLNWVAETFASLGRGLDTDSANLNEAARGYYQRSIDAFGNLLTRSDLQPQLSTQIKARVASVKTQMRDFEGAMGELEQLIRASPNAVNLQVEAARVLQAWGETNSTKYKEAITGIRSREKGGIWGWGKIANATMPHQQFRNTFFEARYEMAKCQIGIAASKQGGERAKQLQAAEKTLSMTKKLYPSLGGPDWQAKYDELITDITSGKVVAN